MKNTTTKKDFMENVKHEVETLKNLATKKEIAKLDFNNLDPNNTDACIYGQMTGHCRSKRALNLISKACATTVKTSDVSLVGSTFNAMKNQINGPYENNLMKVGQCVIHYFSALEAYILLKGSKNKHIIEYLKGETKNLNL